MERVMDDGGGVECGDYDDHNKVFKNYNINTRQHVLT